MIEDKYIPIIGLEIHVELKTKSKMFCGCSANYFGHAPNSHCCPVCLGLPGALPVPNRKAVEWCVMLGLALNCEIPEFSKFDRKNYFYPDLPKGYQISQYDKPFAINGQLVIKPFARGPLAKTIRIRRVHMEEDTGKLLHATVNGEKCTLIDFNRSGVPLVEVVTEPDIENSEEAKVFLKKLHQIIRYLGLSDADMEKGSMRLEPNISIKIKNQSFDYTQDNPERSRMDQKSKIKTTTQISKLKKKVKLQDTSGATGWIRQLAEKAMIPPTVKVSELPPYKVEVKNINSFKFVKKAIDYEIRRQIEILKKGKLPEQETRGWDEKKGITYSQRSKEEIHDYRYFPEPDIPPIRWAESQISNLKSQISELPDQKLNRFIKDYGLSEYDAMLLTDEKETAEYFEKALRHLGGGKLIPLSGRSSGSPDGVGISITPKIIANWIINKKVKVNKVSPEELLQLISKSTQKRDLPLDELMKIINKVIDNNPRAIADYQGGKQSVLMFLVGLVMRELRGQGDAPVIRNLLEKVLRNN